MAEIYAKFNIPISRGTISRWFAENDRISGVFTSQKCLFSNLKCSEENVNYYNNCIEIFFSMHYNNMVFIDEKSFSINLRVRRDPIIGKVPLMVISNSLELRK